MNHCYYQQDFCPITSHTLKSLDNIKSYYEDERICKLKLKTTESLFLYCRNFLNIIKITDLTLTKHMKNLLTGC